MRPANVATTAVWVGCRLRVHRAAPAVAFVNRVAVVERGKVERFDSEGDRASQRRLLGTEVLVSVGGAAAARAATAAPDQRTAANELDEPAQRALGTLRGRPACPCTKQPRPQT